MKTHLLFSFCTLLASLPLPLQGQEADKTSVELHPEAAAAEREKAQQFEILQGKLRAAKEAGREEEAMEISKMIHKLRGDAFGQKNAEPKKDAPKREGGNEAALAGRMEHLQQAIAHLHEAGFKDLAAEVKKAATRQLEAERGDSRKKDGQGDKERPRNEEQLHGHLQKLMQQLQEVTKRLERLEQGQGAPR